MRLAISLAAISIGCGASTVPAAVDPFVGDWKLDPSRSKAIDVMKVHGAKDTTYTFEFEGGGPETIVIDGTDQPGLSGTTLAVTAEGADRWTVVRKQDGRVVITAHWKLGQDGSTLSDDFTEFAPDGQIATHASYLYQRTDAGPGFAGTWERAMALDELPPSAMLQIRPWEAGGLSFLHPAHIVRNVKFDGRDYPLVGPSVAAGTTSSAHRVNERRVDLTDKSAGKINKTEELEVSPDHKTLTQTTHPVGQHGPNVFVFERQANRGPS